jgi:hypothetical protein
MQMELHSNAPIPDGLLATMTLLSEKPRHGVTSWKSAPQSGIDERNCTAAIDLRFRWSKTASDLVVAPNNCVSPGVCKSKIDNMNLMEMGKTSYRDPFSICSTHTLVDNSTGATSSHVDLFNPGTSIPTGPITGNIPALPFHLLFDALPDAIYRVTGHYLLPAGRGLCQ